MASRHKEMQNIIRHYKHETKKREVDMRDVVRWAVTHGWPLPKPIDPIDRLAKEFSQAAREELRTDATTGKPYRVNHAVRVNQNGQVLMFWVDIDEAPRKPMLISVTQRREQMVGDGLQLSLDVDHWNSINSGKEDPIEVQLDFTDDVEWRKNAPDDEEEAG